MSFVDDLIAKINDVERRLSKQERLDRRAALAASAVYSGTPTANAIAYWTGAGTVAGDRAVYVNSGGSVGIGTSSPTQFVHVKKDQDARTTVQVENANNGTAAFASYIVSSDGALASCGKYSRLTPTYKTIVGGDAYLYNDTRGDIDILNDFATGRITFAAGGSSTEHLGIDADGTLRKKAGTSTNDAAVGGVLYEDHATNANGTTVETDLSTYTVPANTLSANGMSLEFEAWITITNNANTKTIKLYFGSDVWTMPTIGGAGSTLYVKGYIVRAGAATQDVFYTAGLTGASPTYVFSTATRTLSGSNVLKFTGQSSAASNDVKQEFFIVSWKDTNV